MIQTLKDKSKLLILRIFTALARDMNVLAQAGPSLVIAPHPDDESLGCGGVIARLRKAGRDIRILVVTDGSASGKSAVISAEQIVAERRAETESAVFALGVTRENLVFLNFRDQHSHEQPDALDAALSDQLREYSPRQIFSPYAVDRHPDHRAIAASVDRLCHAGVIACPVYEYPIWYWSYTAIRELLNPATFMRLRRVAIGEFLKPKQTAVAAHKSQYEAPTNEEGWFTFPSGFLPLFFTPYEIFFEKRR
ncbi:MAG: PIG-L deacetylase family protein [Bdellovibrionales bacterium]